MAVLVGKKAPSFRAKAVLHGNIIGNFTLDQFRGKNVIFFFYPLDFTFVCPTELHAFEEKRAEFEKRNCHIVGCSIDSPFAHLAWLGTPREKGGVQGVNYHLVSDITKTISKDYGVLLEEEGIAYRGLFLIDKEGIVRHQTVNDLPLGRSVEEAMRILDAWIFFETHGEVCPANWKQGHQTMAPTQEGLKKYIAASLSK